MPLHGRDWALVVAGYPWLVRGWRGKANYALNFHPSPLPTGRGPYPLFRAVLDGYETWGVTAHVLAEAGFDTGDIIAQEIFPLRPGETHETLLAKCQMSARRLAAGPLARDLAIAGSAPSRRATALTGRARPTPTVPSTFAQDVAAVLRRVRAFGTVETIARSAMSGGSSRRPTVDRGA